VGVSFLNGKERVEGGLGSDFVYRPVFVGLSDGTKRYVTNHVEAARDTTLFYVIEMAGYILFETRCPTLKLVVCIT
jgi:hypothetical protein